MQRNGIAVALANRKRTFMTALGATGSGVDFNIMGDYISERCPV